MILPLLTSTLKVFDAIHRWKQRKKKTIIPLRRPGGEDPGCTWYSQIGAKWRKEKIVRVNGVCVSKGQDFDPFSRQLVISDNWFETKQFKQIKPYSSEFFYKYNILVKSQTSCFKVKKIGL